MNLDQFLIIAVLFSVLGLFILGRWRYDVVALGALIFCSIIGLVKPTEMFHGFGHPATITVAFVLILSHGLTRSGVTDFIIDALAPVIEYPTLMVACIVLIGAFMSAFMNNIGVLAFLMPVAIQAATRAKQSPSIVLMPLSFATILGGMVTLIGTPPNIIIASYRAEVLGEPYKMFDFSPVGATVALIGVTFLALIGWRFLGKRSKETINPEQLFEIEGYITELRVPKESKLAGKSIGEIEEMISDLDLLIVGLFRRGHRHSTHEPTVVVNPNDILIVEAGPKDTELFIARNTLEIGSGHQKTSIFKAEDTEWIEAVVAPDSRLDGRTVEQMRFPSRHSINLLAVSRQGKPYRGRLKSFRFRVGDVLLFRGGADRLRESVHSLGCLPLLGRGLQLGMRRSPGLAIGIFGGAIAIAGTGLLPFHIAFGLAVIAMVVVNVIPVRELYEGIDWPIIVLLGAMIPIGHAFESSGATTLLVKSFLTYVKGLDPWIVLVLFMICVMGLTDVLNNVATVVLMAPIGRQLAEALNVNIDPFLMVVAVGASCAFLTPIGHQNNALILGPGKYKFGDYWRMGLPLDIIIVSVAVPTILRVWPL
ncbi:MAG: SLC13 family permease [Alphaproteobacteria bacterium]